MGKSFLLELGNYSDWEKKTPKYPNCGVLMVLH